jgi:TRAP-type C4-dicarboxylate transport system permease small subunit
MLQRILDRIDRLIDGLSTGLMFLLLFLTFANVVGRYVFVKSIFFAEELARFLFIWMVFLGAAIIIKTNGHISVDLLPLKLKGKPAGRYLDAFIQLCGFLFLAILFSGGVTLTRVMNVYSSPALGIPIGCVYWVVPLGAGVMLLHNFNAFRRTLKGFRKAGPGPRRGA